MEEVVEDNNLDDFFAKKDKSKKKGKSSKITPDAIEERLERKLKKGKSASTGGKKEKERGDTTDGKTGGILDVNNVEVLDSYLYLFVVLLISVSHIR